MLYEEIESTSERPVTVVGNATYLPVSALDLGDLHPPPFDLGVLFRSARKDQGVDSTLKDMMKWYGVEYQEERLYNAGKWGSAPISSSFRAATDSSLLRRTYLGNSAKYILDTFLQLGRRE